MLLFLISSLIFPPSLAETDSPKFDFYSVQQLGAVFGNMGNSYHFDVSGGVSFIENYKAGIGVSFSPYGVRSMPVFSDLRVDVGRRKNKATVFGRAGVNLFPAIVQTWTWNPDVIEKQQVGTFAEGGLGFKTRLGTKLYYNTSFSYIYKKARYIREGHMRWENGFWIQSGPEQIIAENSMFAMKVGLEF